MKKENDKLIEDLSRLQYFLLGMEFACKHKNREEYGLDNWALTVGHAIDKLKEK